MEKYTINAIEKYIQDIENGAFTYDIDNPTLLHIDRTSKRHREDDAIAAKRQGQYDEAIEIYLEMLYETARNSFMRALPPTICRSLVKVLFAANEYTYGLRLLYPLYNVLNRYYDTLNSEARYLYDQIGMDIHVLIQIVQKYDCNGLVAYSKSYSGNPNYVPVKSSDFLATEIVKIIRFWNNKDN